MYQGLNYHSRVLWDLKRSSSRTKHFPVGSGSCRCSFRPLPAEWSWAAWCWCRGCRSATKSPASANRTRSAFGRVSRRLRSEQAPRTVRMNRPCCIECSLSRQPSSWAWRWSSDQRIWLRSWHRPEGLDCTPHRQLGRDFRRIFWRKRPKWRGGLGDEFFVRKKYFAKLPA